MLVEATTLYNSLKGRHEEVLWRADNVLSLDLRMLQFVQNH